MTGTTPVPDDPRPHDPDPVLADLDAALIGLRRLWAAPPRLADPTLGQVEMSTIWIVDALDRLADHPEVSVADLATAIDVAHSTASRLVDRAEAAGAVSRHPSATDSRRTAVALTPIGRTLATVARQARTSYLARVTTDWSDEQRATLADLLTRLAAAVHHTPPHPPGGTP
jgi:DNA-binding MarR family transcriptional regulator